MFFHSFCHRQDIFNLAEICNTISGTQYKTASFANFFNPNLYLLLYLLLSPIGKGI
jgi:hypothetical protein